MGEASQYLLLQKRRRRRGLYPKPGNLVVTASAHGQASLAWDARPDFTSDDGFQVRYGIAGGGFEDTLDVAAGQVSATITGLDSNQNYQFAVRAKKGGRLGPPALGFIKSLWAGEGVSGAVGHWDSGRASSVLEAVGPDDDAEVGDLIRRITDGTVSGKDVDQATASFQPLAGHSVGMAGFTGSDYLSIAGTGDFNPGSSARSFWCAAWIKPNTAGVYTVFSKEETSSREVFSCFVNASSVAFRTSDDGATNLQTTRAIPALTYSLVVCVFDSVTQDIRLSVNADALNNRPVGYSQVFNDSGVPLYIGVTKGGLSPFSDDIDQLFYGLGSPSQAEVNALYNSGNGRRASEVLGSAATYPVMSAASLALESENGIGVDLSGSGNDMTQNGQIDLSDGAFRRFGLDGLGAIYNDTDVMSSAAFTAVPEYTVLICCRILDADSSSILVDLGTPQVSVDGSGASQKIRITDVIPGATVDADMPDYGDLVKVAASATSSGILSIRVNGESETGTVPGSTSGATIVEMFKDNASSVIRGVMHEVTLFDRVLSSGEISDAFGYFDGRYGS